jgi:hypothetical protein
MRQSDSRKQSAISSNSECVVRVIRPGDKFRTARVITCWEKFLAAVSVDRDSGQLLLIPISCVALKFKRQLIKNVETFSAVAA